MSNTDKQHVDTAATIPNTVLSEAQVEQNDANNVQLHITQYQKSESGIYLDDQKANLVIETANETRAGVMSTDLYTKVTSTLPGQISTETTEREKQYEELNEKGTAFETKVEGYKTSTDNEISSLKSDIAKIADGAGLEENTYTVPSTTSENSHYITGSDSIFGAVEKLDKVLYALYQHYHLTYIPGENGGDGTVTDNSSPQP